MAGVANEVPIAARWLADSAHRLVFAPLLLNEYFRHMAFRAARRRFLCLLTALLFGIGTVAHVHAMTGAVLEMAPAAGEMAPSDHGMDCGGGDKASHAACLSACATAAAILCEPISMPLAMALQETAADPALPAHGRALSPEPHPPKALA
jgi:hypothetical protein